MGRTTQLGIWPRLPLAKTAEGFHVPSEAELLALAVRLGAPLVRGWSKEEHDAVASLPGVSDALVATARNQIAAGQDPLGDAFCRLRSPLRRRSNGAMYTPSPIVRAMADWAGRQGEPARVVDPGAGSGRFIVASGRAFANAALLGVELDPVAAILCRGHLAAAGLAARAAVVAEDYRSLRLEPLEAGRRTLFIGNPPYVRHHLIEPSWKQWLVREATRHGLRASGLAGLHVHFFLATAGLARAGDFGCFITAAEWLDVNYGKLVRDLVARTLGGLRLIVIEPTAQPFPDAQTTGAIVCFEVGTQPTGMTARRIADCSELSGLEGGTHVSRQRLEEETRWSSLTRRGRKAPQDFIELGELCAVHRGQVTGANHVWIAGQHALGLPASVLLPTVTKARELYAAGRELGDASALRRVIDLPADLGVFSGEERKAVEAFLRYAKSLHAQESYIASHRNPWWSVSLREPAPILATYMARRPPAFVVNNAGARHLNIAHGLYPRQAMGKPLLSRLAKYLSENTQLSDGRTYAGGLTKFEPREMERLFVPEPSLLLQWSAA